MGLLSRWVSIRMLPHCAKHQSRQYAAAPCPCSAAAMRCTTPLYGDNVIEKHGINRDRTGEREKTRYLCGKQGIFTRDRALIRPGFIRQLETRASTRSASFFHALGSPGRPHNGGGAAGAYCSETLETRAFEGKKRAARPVPEVTAADKEDGLRGPWSQYSRDGPGRQAGEPCKLGVNPCIN